MFDKKPIKKVMKNIFGDKDKDNVKNWLDCNPFNKKQQGAIHGNNAILYHGTTDKAYANIQQTGLQPRKNYWGPNAVFLAPSKQGAIMYAKKKANGGQPVLLTVSVPLSQLPATTTTNEILDEQNTFRQILVHNPIPPNQIKMEVLENGNEQIQNLIPLTRR